MNILYFGFDLFSPCLEYLISNKDINILKVYSFEGDGMFDFNDKVKDLSVKNGIPFTEDKITKEELDYQFNKNKCDLAFCAGYKYRIPVEFVDDFKGINIHPSLLPALRGPWPLPWIILDELTESGVTAHKISERFDEGDILLQEKFSVSKNETYKSLEEKCGKCALKLTKKLFCDFDKYFSNAYKQEKGEYVREPNDYERTIFADSSESYRDKLIRAFGKDYVIFSNKKKGEE